MKILVYVEGISDKLAMEKLLEPLISEAITGGVAIKFIAIGNKKKLLSTVPIKGANITLNDPQAYVIALPDLHPQNVLFPHRNYEELRDKLLSVFQETVKRKKKSRNCLNRFRVHCFKYELETLILTDKDVLLNYLNLKKTEIEWKIPVEDQNFDNNPTQILNRIFKEAGRNYKKNKTLYAPDLLSQLDYKEVSDVCQQNFKPFVEDLESIISLHSLQR
ncbi:MAG: DUF4276 family protein [Candidatus Eremiobacteraeota bacterium]|nr:DUF4276 family protein [Candidatus Eremiobacteraeota bacterium]